MLSIGSNLGDRLGHLQSVLDAASGLVVTASRAYETKPWGGVEQDDYLNAVLIAEADRDPWAWLRWSQALEVAAGRVRDVRWGTRTLDVDVIDVDGLVLDDPELTLPHPRAGARAFVLVPWLDADPSASLGGVAVSELLSTVDTSVVTLRSELVLR